MKNSAGRDAGKANKVEMTSEKIKTNYIRILKIKNE